MLLLHEPERTGDGDRENERTSEWVQAERAMEWVDFGNNTRAQLCRKAPPHKPTWEFVD